jgi:hypothetical protein
MRNPNVTLGDREGQCEARLKFQLGARSFTNGVQGSERTFGPGDALWQKG